MERTDIISCNDISVDCNAYIEPAYYPNGFDWEYAENGQEYFDEWAAGAVRVLQQHDMEWIKENQPAMWIYLQMVE